jgi:hypothetical protein
MAHVMNFLSKVNGKYENRSPYQGVAKRDWVPTERIDFATHLNGDTDDADQPNEFKLLVEERISCLQDGREWVRSDPCVTNCLCTVPTSQYLSTASDYGQRNCEIPKCCRSIEEWFR